MYDIVSKLCAATFGVLAHAGIIDYFQNRNDFLHGTTEVGEVV